MRLAVLTTGRQDWGILRSTTQMLRDDPRFDLFLFVGGMHCVDRFGRTEALIAEDGFEPAERLAWMVDGATAPADAGRALEAIGGALERHHPDAILLVGDRIETAAAALAATLALVPIVHLHGGEQTAGAFDDALRHAITKLSHLHLVSHADHARRVIALGEAAETVHVVGAPGLDNLRRADLPSRAELEDFLGISLAPPVVIVTLQPTTLAGAGMAEAEIAAVLGAMDGIDATYVVTLPNADPGADRLRHAMVAASNRGRRVAVDALGDRRFWGLLQTADAILGNSSSAIIEAPALGLPAVNVGDRQMGRVRARTVVDVPAEPGLVAEALSRALDPATRLALTGATSPFGDGRSAGRIIEVLANWRPPKPPRKASVSIAESGT